MKLDLVPVTKENRDTAERLSVFPEQKDFIETVTQCMQEADELSSIWHPVCLCDNQVPVGFAMYGYFKYEGKNGRLWFDRFLIDRKYQHHGYGKTGFQTVLEKLQHDYPNEDIYLSVYDNNIPAITMYKEFGFQFNGELDMHGEKVMVLKA